MICAAWRRDQTWLCAVRLIFLCEADFCQDTRIMFGVSTCGRHVGGAPRSSQEETLLLAGESNKPKNPKKPKEQAPKTPSGLWLSSLKAIQRRPSHVVGHRRSTSRLLWGWIPKCSSRGHFSVVGKCLLWEKSSCGCRPLKGKGCAQEQTANGLTWCFFQGLSRAHRSRSESK